MSVSDEPIATRPANISPYLVEADNTLITKRAAPFFDVPKVTRGTHPVDGGFLLLSDAERAEYIKKEPNGEKYIRRLIGAKELLHNIKRWCFWLEDADPSELRHLSLLRERIAKVREFRLASSDAGTRRQAEHSHLFRTPSMQPESSYIAIPAHSSETRKYVPMAFFEPSIIAHNSIHILRGANLYHLGVLQSSMHIAWVRQVGGKLEARLRYSSDLVYNTFAWPESPSPQDVQAVSDAAQAVLEIRGRYPNASLADLYNPLAMPKDLLDVHKRLDKAVDRCYRRETFKTDSERLGFLFERYTAVTASEAKLP